MIRHDRREGLLDHVKRVGEQLRARRRGRSATRWSPASAAPACCSASCSPSRSPPQRRGRAARTPGSWSTRCSRTSIRLAPPLILTTEQADAFLAALPAALDAAVQETVP